MALPYEFVDETLHERRERVFLLFAGLFLGTLAMLNILGITRFIRFGTVTWAGWEFTFAVAVGVLPYPIHLSVHRLHQRVLRTPPGQLRGPGRPAAEHLGRVHSVARRCAARV
jgi:hypothetical protein